MASDFQSKLEKSHFNGNKDPIDATQQRQGLHVEIRDRCVLQQGFHRPTRVRNKRMTAAVVE